VRTPSKRELNLAINVVLLALLVLSFLTGWIASLNGMTEFGLHKWSSIGFVVAVGAHIALHWSDLLTHVRTHSRGGGVFVRAHRIVRPPFTRP
jgi:hypothetical protein